MEPAGSLMCWQEPATGSCSGHMNSIHILTDYFKLHFILSSHLHQDFPSSLFPFGFPTKILYTFLNSPMRATFLAHFNLIDLIILIFADEYKIWSPLSYNFIYPLLLSISCGLIRSLLFCGNIA
jgi:hypothetical protein